MEMNRIPPLGQVAQTMGKMGRGGDTTLVHMNPQEVRGLSSLGELSYNPVTGLPEAFKFKDILPYAGLVGAAFGLPTWGAAMLGGAGTAIKEGSIGKGLMSGLIQFGVGQLMQGVTGKGIDAGQHLGTGQAQQAVTGGVPAGSGMAGEFGVNNVYDQIAGDLGTATTAGPQTFMEAAQVTDKFNPVSSFADSLPEEARMAMTAAPGAILGAGMTETPPEMPQLPERKPFERQQQTLERPQTAPREGESEEELLARIGRGEDTFFEASSYLPVAEGGQLEESFEGMVEGDGHGMEDNKMFTIQGGGLAALSPKEYVVPADVMSGLGNGNPDSGANMMDDFISEFRVEKYGRDQQPPEINGRKLLKNLA